MNIPVQRRNPDIVTLYSLFPPAADIPAYEYVPATEVPQPYHDLLVHEHHMTVTVEKHHGDLVDVRILEKRQEKNWYARKIVLALQGNGQVVQFGIVRIHLDQCSAAVRAAIIAGKSPLGRILIQHNVLRRIEPTAYLRIVPSSAMMAWFGIDQPRPTYGRLAYIHCNEKSAIELLEIVAPESVD